MKLESNVIPWIVSSPLAMAGEILIYVVSAVLGTIAVHFMQRWLNKNYPK